MLLWRFTSKPSPLHTFNRAGFQIPGTFYERLCQRLGGLAGQVASHVDDDVVADLIRLTNVVARIANGATPLNLVLLCTVADDNPAALTMSAFCYIGRKAVPGLATRRHRCDVLCYGFRLPRRDGHSITTR